MKEKKSRDKKKQQMLKRFGQHLRATRKAHGLTQLQLALKCEVERPAISRLEKGGTNPTLQFLINICEALNIKMHELMKGFD